MARFEMTTTLGERILMDHPAADVDAILAELGSNAFLSYTEVKAGASGAPLKVVVASSQIVLVRPLDGLSTQSTTFRPKR
jgi:hypothetical protein